MAGFPNDHVARQEGGRGADIIVQEGKTVTTLYSNIRTVCIKYLKKNWPLDLEP